MQKLYRYTQSVFREGNIPVFLLFVCIVGFGPLIPWLGFYMDDWPYVFYAYHNGIDSLKEMLFYDSRPAAAWLYMSAFWVIGFRPLYWHVTMLILRWLTTITLWASLRAIWPARTMEATEIALVFSIYPFFMLQPSAVGSTHHWFGFLCYGISLWLMIYAGLRQKPALFATAGATLLAGIHLFTSEYFIGLELLRPIVLWILLSRNEKDIIKVFKLTLTKWLPYLGVLAFYFYWRVFLFSYAPDTTRNTPVIFEQLLHQPLSASWFLFNTAVKDSVSVLTRGWQLALDANLIDFETLFGRFRFLLSIFSFLVVYIFLERLTARYPAAQNQDDWNRKSILIAILGLVVGGLPIWLIGRSFLDSPNLVSASRFGLPAMLGAAFVLILTINYFVSDRRKQLVVISFLVSIAINYHLDNTKDFQYFWEKQVRLYQEMAWRIPAMEPGTAIVTNQEILGYMGQYATSFAIMTVYDTGKITSPPYWYFPQQYSYPNIDNFVNGEPIEDNKLSMHFRGQSSASLIISFAPELDQCLWVQQPRDANLNLLSDGMKKLSTVSAIERINSNNGFDRTLPEIIFGASHDKGWCYFFEQADYARQEQQWNRVIELFHQAEANHLSPGNGFEYAPFIDGFAYLGDWKNAFKLTKSANKLSKGMDDFFCPMWQTLATDTPPDTEKDEYIHNTYELLRCVP